MSSMHHAAIDTPASVPTPTSPPLDGYRDQAERVGTGIAAIALQSFAFPTEETLAIGQARLRNGRTASVIS